jgi:hypothetical protein
MSEVGAVIEKEVGTRLGKAYASWMGIGSMYIGNAFTLKSSRLQKGKKEKSCLSLCYRVKI